MTRFNKFLILIAIVLVFGGETTSASAANLIPNANLETADPTGAPRPQYWISGRWGNNTTSFVYPATGVNNSRAAKVNVTAWSSGDAKWTTAAPINIDKSGQTYEYSDYYLANVPTIVTAEFRLAGGALAYVDLGTVPAASSWSQRSFRFVPPDSATSLRIFHLINRVGSLSIDNASLTTVATNPPPTDPNNLVPNPSLEITNSQGQPQNWHQGRWGTNSASFVFPVAGQSGVNAARINLTAHTSGDAKWYFSDAVVRAGTTYEFANYSKSNVTTYITARFTRGDGTVSYQDLGTKGPSSAWSQFRGSFTVPSGVTTVTVFHLIRNVGFLEVDNFSLRATTTSDPTQFDRGYISLNFDDGYLSAYQNAIPILDAAGFKSDQYIITERLSPNFPGYVKNNHVIDMQARGHKIGAHSRTHPDLTTLSSAQAQSEISGSRNDLLAIGATPVSTFSYPFGGYNSTVQQLVRNAGFIGARSSDGGYNTKQQDIYALRRFSMTRTTTIAQVRSYIDTAINNKSWAILLFHDVSQSGASFAVTPQFFQQVVDCLRQRGITPITNDQGINLIRN